MSDIEMQDAPPSIVETNQSSGFPFTIGEVVVAIAIVAISLFMVRLNAKIDSKQDAIVVVDMEALTELVSADILSRSEPEILLQNRTVALMDFAELEAQKLSEEARVTVVVKQAIIGTPRKARDVTEFVFERAVERADAVMGQ